MSDPSDEPTFVDVRPTGSYGPAENEAQGEPEAGEELAFSDDAAEGPAPEEDALGGDEDVAFSDEREPATGAPEEDAAEPEGEDLAFSDAAAAAPAEGADAEEAAEAAPDEDDEVTFDESRQVAAPASPPPLPDVAQLAGLPMPPASRRRPSGRQSGIRSSGIRSGFGHGSSAAPPEPPAPKPLRVGEAWDRRRRGPEEHAQALAHLGERPAPEGDPFLGRTLGPFTVETFLAVERGERRYIALEAQSGERALLQVFPLRGRHAAAAEWVAGRADAARVEHPALGLTLGAGRTKDCYYLGTEPPLGEPIAALLARGERLDPDEALDLLEQVGDALRALHRRDLLHGDVSPETVWRERKGSFVLRGAGARRPHAALAFLEAGGEVSGTPGFVAPEALDGAPSAASELYALGCVAWAALSGRPPFPEADPVAAALAAAAGPVPPLAVEGVRLSPSLPALIAKLTGQQLRARYPSADALLTDLKAHRRGEPVRPFPPALSEPEALVGAKPPAPLRASTVLLVLLAALDLALLVSVGAIFWRTQMLPLEDPVADYELPLPGIGEGGYVLERDPRALKARDE